MIVRTNRVSRRYFMMVMISNSAHVRIRPLVRAAAGRCNHAGCTPMNKPLLAPETREFTARALLVGQRIDLKALGSQQRLGGGPLVLSVRGGGAAIISRYGAVVLFDVQPLEEDEFLRQLRPRVQNPNVEPEAEQVAVRIDPEAKEVLEGVYVILKD